jgi:hypothetical protein
VAIPHWRVGGQVEQPAQVRRTSTLDDPNWNNSTVLNGEAVSEVSKLKQELDGDIVVLASL